MTRVIHTGDTHIGYQQYHSQTRREDFLHAFRQVITDACDASVDAVIHAGDLFHDRRPSLTDLLGTIDILRDLREADIPFLAVVGNHESTRHGQWLDLFERLGLAERLNGSPRYIDNNLALYGLDHVPPSRREDLEYEFDPHEATHAALVSHGLFTPFAHGDWETEMVLTAASVDFDAMLLGDNHAPGIETVKDTWVTYCGSTERTSATEESARGYNLITFDTEVDIRRRSLETRPFVFISVDLSAGEGTERVCDRLREYDLHDAVVVIEITGDGDSVPPATIETFATDHGALIARVTDRREHPETESIDTDISFADPDAAVEQRIRELDLSTAAHNIDTTIRSDSISDSNVRDTVTEDVSELLTNESLDAFDPSSTTETHASPTTTPTESKQTSSESESESESSLSPTDHTTNPSSTNDSLTNHTSSARQTHSTVQNDDPDVNTDPENAPVDGGNAIISDVKGMTDVGESTGAVTKTDSDNTTENGFGIGSESKSESDQQQKSKPEQRSDTATHSRSETDPNADTIEETESSEDDEPDATADQFTMEDF